MFSSKDHEPAFTPFEKAEKVYQDLVEWYGEADEKELRSAAKLLLVALQAFSEHGGARWHSLVMEYVNAAKFDPERFEKMMESNRGELKQKTTGFLQ